jgi:hypothetical protein
MARGKPPKARVKGQTPETYEMKKIIELKKVFY